MLELGSVKKLSKSIIDRLKRNDPDAFREFFDFYYVDLCKHSLKYCDSFSMSEDIVQEFFIKFWNEKLYLKIDGSVKAYIYKSVRNNTLQAMRKIKLYSEEMLEDRLMVVSDEQYYEVSEENNKLNIFDKIEALPQRSKEVFKAIVLDNMKYKEVASLMGISVNTVKTHYVRSLKKMRS